RCKKIGHGRQKQDSEVLGCYNQKESDKRKPSSIRYLGFIFTRRQASCDRRRIEAGASMECLRRPGDDHFQDQRGRDQRRRLFRGWRKTLDCDEKWFVASP